MSAETVEPLSGPAEIVWALNAMQGGMTRDFAHELAARFAATINAKDATIDRLQARADQAVAHDWRPISTAPKDRTRIETFWVAGGSNQVEHIRWMDLSGEAALFSALSGVSNIPVKEPYWAKDDGTEFPNAMWWRPSIAPDLRRAVPLNQTSETQKPTAERPT